MKRICLLLTVLLLCSTLFAQTAEDRQISCIDGIPLECLYTGDWLKGENVTYEVKKGGRFLFFRNVNNRCDTLHVDEVLGKHIHNANTEFDSLKNNVLKSVYDYLTREEIAKVVHEDAFLNVHCVLDSSFRVRELIFVLPKHFCDYDDNDKLWVDSVCAKMSADGVLPENINLWRDLYIKRSIGSDQSKACFWRTFPVDRFHEIEKEIIEKARLNEDDVYYQDMIENGWWKNRYFSVTIHPRLLEKMRENGGIPPDNSVFYDVFVGNSL